MTDLLTSEQVAIEVFAGAVSPHSVRRWIAKGVGVPKVKLPARRLGRNYFVARADAEAFRERIGDPELYRRRQTTERARGAVRRLQKAGA